MWITDSFAEMGWLELGGFSVDNGFNGVRSGFGLGI